MRDLKEIIMMRISQMRAIGALTILCLLIGSTALANPGFGPGRVGMRPRLLADLQLTSDQRAQIDNIFTTRREAIRALVQQLRERQTAIREAARTQPFDETLVRSQAQEMAGIQTELVVARTELINSVLGVLTDEQKARLKEFRDQRIQQFREWRKQSLSGLAEPQQN